MKANFLENIPNSINAEIIEILQNSNDFRIERIISFGQRSEDGFWYDQEENEWVIVLKGNAGIRFEGNSDIIHLNEMDYILIPAHKKHRVEFTAINEETIWLAIFWK